MIIRPMDYTALFFRITIGSYNTADRPLVRSLPHTSGTVQYCETATRASVQGTLKAHDNVLHTGARRPPFDPIQWQFITPPKGPACASCHTTRLGFTMYGRQHTSLRPLSKARATLIGEGPTSSHHHHYYRESDPRLTRSRQGAEIPVYL
jgi:hypothetical protein